MAREGFEVGFQVRDKELYRGEFLDGLRHHLGEIGGLAVVLLVRVVCVCGTGVLEGMQWIVLELL